MKVSKPIIILLVVAVGFVIYLYVFAGKKEVPPAQQQQPGAQNTPVPPGAPQPPQALQGAVPPGTPDISKPGTPGAGTRPDVSAYVRPGDVQKIETGWRDDPFLLPNVFDRKSLAEEKVAQKVLAILDGRKGRVAVIDNEVVKRGDRIGLEKIVEIRKDRVVLSRNGLTRTIVLDDPGQKIFSSQEKSSGEGK